MPATMTNTTLANALRDERRRRGLSQEGAAKELGVLQQTYANWELGSVPRPSPKGKRGSRDFQETIQRIAQFLGVPVLEVLKIAYTPDLRLPDESIVDAYRRRIEELEEALEAMREGR